MMLIAIKPLKRKQKQNILHSAAASERRQWQVFPCSLRVKEFATIHWGSEILSPTLLVFFSSSFVCSTAVGCRTFPGTEETSTIRGNVPWSRLALAPSSPATPRGRYLKRPRHQASPNAKTYYYIAVCTQQQKVHLIQCSRY
jgi:hypothetical protein